MYKSKVIEYKDSYENLYNLNNSSKSKLYSLGSNDTINTLDTNDSLDSCSYSIRSRTNSNSSNIGNSRNSSVDIDINADKKHNNFLYIEKKECLETPNTEIKIKKKRIKDEELLPLSKSPNVCSILEKIPSLKLNKILKETYKDISSNILEKN